MITGTYRQDIRAAGVFSTYLPGITCLAQHCLFALLVYQQSSNVRFWHKAKLQQANVRYEREADVKLMAIGILCHIKHNNPILEHSR